MALVAFSAQPAAAESPAPAPTSWFASWFSHASDSSAEQDQHESVMAQTGGDEYVDSQEAKDSSDNPTGVVVNVSLNSELQQTPGQTSPASLLQEDERTANL